MLLVYELASVSKSSMSVPKVGSTATCRRYCLASCTGVHWNTVAGVFTASAFAGSSSVGGADCLVKLCAPLVSGSAETRSPFAASAGRTAQ